MQHDPANAIVLLQSCGILLEPQEVTQGLVVEMPDILVPARHVRNFSEAFHVEFSNLRRHEKVVVQDSAP